MSETAIPSDGQTERRRAPRAALRLSATMREPGRSRTGIRVIDISTHGCRIEATNCASADAWIWLSIAGLETQYCRVVWKAQEFAGLEFATPLSDAVLERLLNEQQQLSESTVKELRDIASRTHRLATTQVNGEVQTLTELSTKCAVDAVIEGLRLGESKTASPESGRRKASR